jgi:hypothetical protein
VLSVARGSFTLPTTKKPFSTKNPRWLGRSPLQLADEALRSQVHRSTHEALIYRRLETKPRIYGTR